MPDDDKTYPTDHLRPGTPAYCRIVDKCVHRWIVKCDFGGGFKNLTCNKCGHKKGCNAEPKARVIMSEQKLLSRWDSQKQQAWRKNNGNEYLEICMLIDESGSMEEYKKSVLEGAQRYLQALKQMNVYLGMWCSLKFGQSAPSKKQVRFVPLSSGSTITHRDYEPLGGTALYDALGSVLMSETEAKRLVIILTDGEDNMSMHWNLMSCGEMIKSRQELDDWLFVFLAAYPEGLRVGHDLNIHRDNCRVFPGSDLPKIFDLLRRSTEKFIQARNEKRLTSHKFLLNA